MGALALCRTATCVNSPEVRSIVYGWITLILTSVIGGIGWWIKHVTDRRDAERKADDERDPKRDEIFTKQMEMILADCRNQLQLRDERIDRRDTEIAALKAEIDRIRQGSARRRTDTREGPG
jgi:hypothetical protein